MRRGRLSRSADFERVYRQGRSKSNRFLVLYAFPRTAEAKAAPSAALDPLYTEAEAGSAAAPGPRLGLSVSRRVGGAVTRTHVKRVIREAFWADVARLPGEADYVVVARPDAAALAEREGMKGIASALSELIDGLGGRPASSQPPPPHAPSEPHP